MASAGMLLACICAAAATAQMSVQQAMLRSQAVPMATPAAAAPAPARNVADALQSIAMQAGVVFTGAVVETRPDGADGAFVSFHVERGVRGVASGATYTAHISAWAGGSGRYPVGQRALFLLTAPSVAGFSAPVMGERGIVPLSGDSLVGNLDLRWIAADVQRVPSSSANRARSAQALAAAEAPATANAHSLASGNAAAVEQGSPALGGLPDVQAIDRDLVLDLLRTSDFAAEHVL